MVPTREMIVIDGENWLYSGYSLKVEQTKYPDRLAMAYEFKERCRGRLEGFGLSIWKDQVETDKTVNKVILRGKNRSKPAEFKDSVINLSGEVE